MQYNYLLYPVEEGFVPVGGVGSALSVVPEGQETAGSRMKRVLGRASKILDVIQDMFPYL